MAYHINTPYYSVYDSVTMVKAKAYTVETAKTDSRQYAHVVFHFFLGNHVVGSLWINSIYLLLSTNVVLWHWGQRKQETYG